MERHAHRRRQDSPLEEQDRGRGSTKVSQGGHAHRFKRSSPIGGNERGVAPHVSREGTPTGAAREFHWVGRGGGVAPHDFPTRTRPQRARPPLRWGQRGGEEQGAWLAGASKSEGACADARVDVLVQGQVVALLEVQEEEAVGGLAGVEALVLQPRLLDLEGACEEGQERQEMGVLEGAALEPNSLVPPSLPHLHPAPSSHICPQEDLPDTTLSDNQSVRALLHRRAECYGQVTCLSLRGH